MARALAQAPQDQRASLAVLLMRALGYASVLVCLGACGEDAGALGTFARIRGQVRDAESGARLGSARLIFTSDTLEQFETRSNRDGEYSLEVDSRATHGRIEARKKGYAPRIVSVFLDDVEVDIDVRLTPED